MVGRRACKLRTLAVVLDRLLERLANVAEVLLDFIHERFFFPACPALLDGWPEAFRLMSKARPLEILIHDVSTLGAFIALNLIEDLHQVLVCYLVSGHLYFLNYV